LPAHADQARLRHHRRAHLFAAAQSADPGHAYLSSTPLAVSAQPYLDRISDQLHEAANMATLEGDDILYIARSATVSG
jgi:DNA-binding IclR family transcriptional regulator